MKASFPKQGGIYSQELGAKRTFPLSEYQILCFSAIAEGKTSNYNHYHTQARMSTVLIL